MALEDFFTLTEMKDGLSTPDRVDELINHMRNEKDNDAKNVGEISSHWCTVAKTIANTDDKECLDRFVQLSGLCVFNTWLNDILKNDCEIYDGVVEESIVALLQALEKLPVDNEKLTSSGIEISLQSLSVHNSTVIKERVHMLLDSWKVNMKSSKVAVDVKENISVGGCTNTTANSNERSSVDLDGNNEDKSTTVGHNSGVPDSLTSEKVKEALNAECGIEVDSEEMLNHEAVKDGNSFTPHSTDLCTMKENVSVTALTSADGDKEFTNTRNESYSNSKREEGGTLEQDMEVLADVGSAENGIKTTSIEHGTDQPSISIRQETECSSLRSDDSKVEKPAKKAAQKDIVMVVSEGMGIPGTICSLSQEKIVDGPAEQVFESLPQTASSDKEFSSDIITAKAKDDLDVIEPSHANAVVQDAEIETRTMLGFDLNEEVISEDIGTPAVSNQDLCHKGDHHMINQKFMATSVISASRLAAVSELPAGRLHFEGTLGWKGSAATSAFRPASPRKPLESDNVTSSTDPSSNSLKQIQCVHGFDLNMADDEFADNNTPDSVIAVSSSHPSEESCVEIGPSKSKRTELDLNSLGDAPPSTYWSVNGLPFTFSQKNVYRSPSPASSSSSVHPSMLNLDLNKNLSAQNFPFDPSPYRAHATINFVEGHRVRPASSEISILGTKVEVGRDEPFQSQLHPNANISGFRNFFPPSMNLSPSLQPSMHSPGIPMTMSVPRGSSLLPHMIGPAQPSYLMNMMGAPPPPPHAPINVTPPSYSSFDPNVLYMNNAANRNEPYTRQYLMSTQGAFLEPHSTLIPQPSSLLTKRKEPHSGWDPYQR